MNVEDRAARHVNEEGCKGLRDCFADGGYNLIRDEVAEAVEDEDTEEISSQRITPSFMVEDVLRGGAAGSREDQPVYSKYLRCSRDDADLSCLHTSLELLKSPLRPSQHRAEPPMPD